MEYQDTQERGLACVHFRKVKVARFFHPVFSARAAFHPSSMLLTSTPLERHSAARVFLFVLQSGRSIILILISVSSRGHQQRMLPEAEPPACCSSARC
ncbi:uncharacterized [Tachysurus ichikawai]